MTLLSSIYDLKLEMGDAFYGEPFECSTVKALTTIFGRVLYTYISNFNFDTRVELNMFFTFVAVVIE